VQANPTHNFIEWKALHFLTNQALYVQRNIKARSRNHCYLWKKISITYSEYVSVVLVIQHVMRVPHIVFRGLSASKIFFHIIL